MVSQPGSYEELDKFMSDYNNMMPNANIMVLTCVASCAVGGSQGTQLREAGDCLSLTRGGRGSRWFGLWWIEESRAIRVSHIKIITFVYPRILFIQIEDENIFIAWLDKLLLITYVFVLVSVTVTLSGSRGYLSNKSGLTLESNLANQDILIMHKLGGVTPATDKYRLTQN